VAPIRPNISPLKGPECIPEVPHCHGPTVLAIPSRRSDKSCRDSSPSAGDMGDIDLLHHLVAIDENAPEVGGKRTVGPPKSEAGTRQVAIPAPIMPDVETHLDRFVAPEADA